MNSYWSIYSSSCYLSFIPLKFLFRILINPNDYSDFMVDFVLIFSFSLDFLIYLKPFQYNIIDKKMKNGLGVMLDDIISWIFILQLLYFYLQNII